jgi:hypothetical protein
MSPVEQKSSSASFLDVLVSLGLGVLIVLWALWFKAQLETGDLYKAEWAFTTAFFMIPVGWLFLFFGVKIFEDLKEDW